MDYQRVRAGFENIQEPRLEMGVALRVDNRRRLNGYGGSRFRRRRAPIFFAAVGFLCAALDSRTFVQHILGVLLVFYARRLSVRRQSSFQRNGARLDDERTETLE